MEKLQKSLFLKRPAEQFPRMQRFRKHPKPKNNAKTAPDIRCGFSLWMDLENDTLLRRCRREEGGLIQGRLWLSANPEVYTILNKLFSVR